MQNNKNRFLPFIIHIIITGVLVWVDQFTKFMAVDRLKNKEEISVIPKILSFSYVENDGAAWGIFGGKRAMFVILTIVMFLIICFVIYRLNIVRNEENKRVLGMMEIDLYVLIAGAVGNFIDRIKVGYVVDFIKTDFISFPVFNVADCYVTVSMIVLIILILFFVKEEDLDVILSFRKNVSRE